MCPSLITEIWWILDPRDYFYKIQFRTILILYAPVLITEFWWILDPRDYLYKIKLRTVKFMCPILIFKFQGILHSSDHLYRLHISYNFMLICPNLNCHTWWDFAPPTFTFTGSNCEYFHVSCAPLLPVSREVASQRL